MKQNSTGMKTSFSNKLFLHAAVLCVPPRPRIAWRMGRGGTLPYYKPVSKNNLPLLPLNLALVNDGRTFAAEKPKVQSRPEFVADAASGPGSKQTVNQFRRRLSRKKNK